MKTLKCIATKIAVAKRTQVQGNWPFQGEVVHLLFCEKISDRVFLELSSLAKVFGL
jgi:hypothetical protein